MKPEVWMTEYPTLETVMCAGFATLDSWAQHLPDPQTDVQRTILRRAKVRRDELMMVEVRRTAPDVADKLADAYAAVDRLIPGLRDKLRDARR